MFFRLRTISLLICLSLLSVNSVHAFIWQSAKIQIPKYCELKAPSPVSVKSLGEGQHVLYFPKHTKFPVILHIIDPFGVVYDILVNSLGDVKNFKINDDYIVQKSPNPVHVYHVPRLCPRVTIKDKKAYYQTDKDFLNRKPGVYLFDPDYQYVTLQHNIQRVFDKKNSLKIIRVKIKYDYEDNAILDYKGPHPITQKEQLVYEGNGGFYANFHYAIVPYDERLFHLSRQELLNLAQGKLHYINRMDLLPDIRTHSFIPGPYVSTSGVYVMCEWGDTAFQAKEQELFYDNFYVWDWDFKNKNNQLINKVMMIVWEGDEEDWLIAEGLLDPFYLTDDLVGLFVIEKEKTTNSHTVINQQGDFEIELQTQK